MNQNVKFRNVFIKLAASACVSVALMACSDDGSSPVQAERNAVPKKVVDESDLQTGVPSTGNPNTCASTCDPDAEYCVDVCAEEPYVEPVVDPNPCYSPCPPDVDYCIDVCADEPYVGLADDSCMKDGGC